MQRVILDPRHLRPRGATITHRNGDTLDNRRDNLCWAVGTGDRAAKRPPKRSRTGFLGVQLFGAGLYRVQLQVGGRRWSGGTHIEPVNAARAYNALALRYIGPGATLNTVPHPVFDQAIYEGAPRKRRSPRKAAHPGTQGPCPASATSAGIGRQQPAATDGDRVDV